MKKRALAALVVLILVGGAIVLGLASGNSDPSAQPTPTSSPPPRVRSQQDMDCNSDAPIWCGFYDQAALVTKLHNGDGNHAPEDLRGLFQSAQIDISDAGVLGSNDGIVTPDGQVLVETAPGNRNFTKVVATQTMVGHRDSRPGDVIAGRLWFSKPEVALKAAQPAIVNLDGGSFQWALLKSNGDPVVVAPDVAS